MYIEKLRIRNFRSIEDVTFPLGRFAVLCGPNSCGKSNVFRAIQLAFKAMVSESDARENLTRSKLVAGGPLLSVWVDCRLADAPAEVQQLAGVTTSTLTYSFRLTRGGTVTRKLADKVLDDQGFSDFLELFRPIYVPPIRDLSADGLDPFVRLMKSALKRAKGPGNIKHASDQAKKVVERKAAALLGQHDDLVESLLSADKLIVDAGDFDLESLYGDVRLRVKKGEESVPLSALGTGHQSAVIIHLYRQLGEDLPALSVRGTRQPSASLNDTGYLQRPKDDFKVIPGTCKHAFAGVPWPHGIHRPFASGAR